MAEQYKNTYPTIPVESFADSPEISLDFSDLKKSANIIGDRWHEDGYATTRPYLDGEGNFILLAKADNAPSSWRFSINDNTDRYYRSGIPANQRYTG